jgi:hypothetical protein
VSTPSPPELAIDRLARKRLKRHFKLNYWLYWPELSMLAGFLALICALAFLDAFWSWLLGSIVLGGTGYICRSSRIMYFASEKEFDHIAETDYKAAQSLALARFELTASDLRDPEPCKFRSATKRDIGNAFSGLRVGPDERPRRTPMEYLVVNFGHENLFMFRCVWDLTTGNTLWEETHEFAYVDIACVELTHKKETIRINLRTRELLPALKKEGIVPLHRAVQVPTEESVSLRLASGELVELASWRRSTGGIFSGEGKRAFATAQRLQKLVRDFRHLRPTAAPARTAAHAPRAPTLPSGSADPAAPSIPTPSPVKSPTIKPTPARPAVPTIRHVRGDS